MLTTSFYLPDSVVGRILAACDAFIRFLSLTLLLLLLLLVAAAAAAATADDDGRPNFLRCRILFTIVSLFRLATVDAIAATVVCDVVGI